MSFYKEVPGRQTTLESTLKFDTEPKAGSTNPVTSEGVKSAIDGAVGDAAENLQDQIDDIAEKAGSGYIPKGEATVATLNALSEQENGELYTMTDAGTLTEGSLAVVAGDTVAWDATNEVWYKAMDYAPRQYGTNEVHNLPTTITAFRTGDFIAVDGPSGTAKMPADRISERNDVGYTYVKNDSDGSVNLSESFTSGQKILIVATTDSDVTANINGNVIFTDSTKQYPAISVVNGFGYIELTYNKDGHLGTFGGVGVSGKKVVFKVVVCDESGESALYSLFELHQKNVSAITTNASNISNNAREIAKNDGVEYIKNTSDGSVNLSETFTSGQKILIVAYTDSDVTANINGNVRFTDSTLQYPAISVVNGFGYKELTYNKDGHLGTFGGVGVSGKKVVFKVVVCDEEGESTLYGLINAIKEIADLHVEQTPNVFASFKKIAIVGDSLGSGESVYKDSSNQLHYVDNYDYSWIQIMAKQNGQTAYNFSKSGEWCADWLNPSNTRGITMAQSNPADCYFIGLGHNDSHDDRQETQPLGTIADVNVGSEGSNPSTFYGNYSKIIASLKSITNRCRIFCVTSPSLESSAPQFNQAIRDVAGLYSMCYVLELGNDPYYASSFIESQKYAAHYSAAAYAAMATHINELLNDYIISHPSDFRGIQWIGTNYDVVAGG